MMNFNVLHSPQNFLEPPSYYSELFASFCSLKSDLENLNKKNQELSNKISEKINSIAVLEKKTSQIVSNRKNRIDQEDLFRKYLSPLKIKQSNIDQSLIQKSGNISKSSPQKNQINQLTFVCSYKQCQKQYNSQISLNLHIKLKHNGGSKKERQAYAKLILQSEQKGQTVPKIFIELPPNYMKNYKEKQISKVKNSKKIADENLQECKEKI